MSATEFVLRHPALLALGWALVHFIWQGAIVGAAAAVLLRAARQSAASTRYAIAAIAMAVMFVTAAGTWIYLAGREARLVPASVSHVSSAAIVSPLVGTADGVGRLQSPAPDATVFPAAEAQPAGAPIALATFLFLYAAGVLALSLRLAGGWYLANRLVRRRVRCAAPELVALADRVAGRLAVHRVVRVLESALVTTPAVVGWIAPVVLLPAAALAGLAPAQLEALLAHELAHVKRHDYLVNLLQSAVETLLFYHPAVWWVSRQIRIEREHCCDDVAVALCGDRMVYASALADLEAMRMPAFALAATDGSLVSRMRRILAVPAEPRTTAPGWMGVALVLLVVSVLPAVINSARADGTKLANQAAARGTKPPAPPQPRKAAAPANQQSAAYQIRATDVLHIVVAGEPTLSRNYAVESDGMIVFPLMRPLAVVGLTTDAVARAITRALTLAAAGQQQQLAARKALDDANQMVTSAQIKYDRLKAYNIDDPKTDIVKSGALNDPDIKTDGDVRQRLAQIEQVERSLKQQEFLGRGKTYPDVMQLNAQQTENWANLRLEIEGLVETAKVELDRSLQLAISGEAPLLGRPSVSRAPKVTVTVAKPGAPQPAQSSRPSVPPVQAPIEPAHSETFLVSGEVREPGQIQLTAEQVTLLQALRAAGGPTVQAGPDVVVRRHKGASVTGMIAANQTGSDIESTSYNIEDIDAGRIPDPVLRNGDTVYVPRAKAVIVNGEVMQPGWVTWREGMTVTQALAGAGGPTPDAATNRMKIRRLDPAKHLYQQITAKFAMILKPGDVLTVPKVYLSR